VLYSPPCRVAKKGGQVRPEKGEGGGPGGGGAIAGVSREFFGPGGDGRKLSFVQLFLFGLAPGAHKSIDLRLAGGGGTGPIAPGAIRGDSGNNSREKNNWKAGDWSKSEVEEGNVPMKGLGHVAGPGVGPRQWKGWEQTHAFFGAPTVRFFFQQTQLSCSGIKRKGGGNFFPGGVRRRGLSFFFGHRTGDGCSEPKPRKKLFRSPLGKLKVGQGGRGATSPGLAGKASPGGGGGGTPGLRGRWGGNSSDTRRTSDRRGVFLWPKGGGGGGGRDGGRVKPGPGGGGDRGGRGSWEVPQGRWGWRFFRG